MATSSSGPPWPLCRWNPQTTMKATSLIHCWPGVPQPCCLSLSSSPHQHSQADFLQPCPAVFWTAPSELTHDTCDATSMVSQSASFSTARQPITPSSLRPSVPWLPVQPLPVCSWVSGHAASVSSAGSVFPGLLSVSLLRPGHEPCSGQQPLSFQQL